MTYTTLGKTGLSISRLGFGCMSLQPDSTDSISIIRDAVEAGITYFDTADLYDKGANETMLGKALNGLRYQVVLATKVGNQWRPDGSGWDWNPTKAYLLQAIDKSLQRLQTDYIDLYQLHGGTIEDQFDEIIEAFELLVQQGKIRHYGISSLRPNVIRRFVAGSTIQSVMLPYSLLDRRADETLLPLLEKKGISVLARGSLAQGLLVDKPAKPYINYTAEEVTKAATAITKISGKHRCPAQTALQFVLQKKGITAAVVGIRTKAQLQDAIKATNAALLNKKEWQELAETLPHNNYTEHR